MPLNAFTEKWCIKIGRQRCVRLAWHAVNVDVSFTWLEHFISMPRTTFFIDSQNYFFRRCSEQLFSSMFRTNLSHRCPELLFSSSVRHSKLILPFNKDVEEKNSWDLKWSSQFLDVLDKASIKRDRKCSVVSRSRVSAEIVLRLWHRRASKIARTLRFIVSNCYQLSIIDLCLQAFLEAVSNSLHRSECHVVGIYQSLMGV